MGSRSVAGNVRPRLALVELDQLIILASRSWIVSVPYRVVSYLRSCSSSRRRSLRSFSLLSLLRYLPLGTTSCQGHPYLLARSDPRAPCFPPHADLVSPYLTPSRPRCNADRAKAKHVELPRLRFRSIKKSTTPYLTHTPIRLGQADDSSSPRFRHRVARLSYPPSS